MATSDFPIYEWKTLREQWGQALRFSGTDLFLFRHGETHYNEQDLITGAADIDLNETGQRQCRELGAALGAPFDFAFCSPLRRSVASLELALGGAKPHGAQPPIRRDPRLSERALGAIEGSKAEPMAEFARGDLDFHPTGGESYRSLSRRCLSFLLDLRRLIDARDATRVAVCSHMGPMRVFKALFEAQSDPTRMMAQTLANGQIHEFRLDEIAWPEFLK